MQFFRDAMFFMGYAMVSLVAAIIAAAIIMEAYEWLIDTWGLIFG